MSDTPSSFAGDRLAKVIARAGLCSRRDAELWIKDGRVAVNGKVIRTPAFNVTEKDQVKVDGQPLQARQGTRVWLYHKPAGLVVTEKDPEGRATIFETLEQQGLPRVVSIGRLDINTEGLLLLTNDGGLKRVLELPATGWLRRYRVRAFGTITQPQLDALATGLEVDGIKYGPIEATLEREQGSNVWMVLSLREGKNREVKNVLGALGLKVNRLIRVSFGPFQLGELPIGAVEVVRARVLREQLGKRLADEAGVDFDSELPEPAAIRQARNAANPAFRAAAPGKEEPRQRRRDGDFRFAERTDKTRGPRPPRREDRDERPAPPRTVFNDDGSTTEFVAKTYGKPAREARSGDKPGFRKSYDRPAGASDDRPRRPHRARQADDVGAPPRRPYAPRSAEGAERPRRSYGDKPRGDFGDRPKRSYAPRSAEGAERPRRSYGDKPKGDFGDRPKRPYAPRSAEGAERPKRNYGDKPKGDFGDRPKRTYAPRSAEGAERPKRNYGDKPKGDFGDRPKRPYASRSAEGAERPKRSYSDKPKGDLGDRPKRTYGDKPRGPRPAGAEARAPRGPRPAGGAPKRPRGSGPGGDRPRRPRPPKA
jgi:23S rRNA pseudouridine2605 synthase